MNNNKLGYEDIKQYEFILDKVPSFLLGSMIRKNANLVKKFESIILSKLNSLTSVQEEQLDIVLNLDIDEIQNILKDAYNKSGKKQYKQLSDSKSADFIEKNLLELKKLVSKN